MRLAELAQRLGAELDLLPPDSPSSVTADADVSGCATLDDAGPGQLTFLASPKYAGKLASTRASAVIVAEDVRRPPGLAAALLRAKDPYFTFRNAVIELHGFRRHPHTGVHPLAYIDPTATIGEGTVIYPFVYVGPRARVGRDCILYPFVCVYDDSVLGDRVILHAGCSIGHDGFGHATHALAGQPPAHHKIPQVGNAVIEDDVELGANCSIDRATLGSTVIGRGTKFSNNVVIGHGTRVGPHNLFVAQVGLAGSVTTGSYVVMGGQAGVAGHLSIADGVQLSAQAGVMNDIEEKGQYIGAPAMPGPQARRVYNHFLNLDQIVKRIKELEKQVAELQASR